jgi:hypothetical protein
MHVIRARNANQALPEMMHYVRDSGLVVKRDSRNGPVLQFAEPFCIKYQRPTQRVVFWEERDANPFFHLFESLWMIAGRNDVAYPARYSSNIAQFSDDGHTFHGAYGYRWRKHFQVLMDPQKGAGASTRWRPFATPSRRIPRTAAKCSRCGTQPPTWADRGRTCPVT